MPYSIKGRNVLVTGGSRGLGAEIARKFAAEGANVAINYANNEEPARKLAAELKENHKVKTTVIKADCGNMADVTACVKEATKFFGGLDIIIGNHGWTRFSDFNDLEALSEAEWDKCFKTNVLGMKQLVSSSLPTFNANPEGGVVIITSSIAGKTIGGSSMAYSVTKAAQLHLVKCMAKTQGSKVRINAILPGLLLTDWGLSYGDERIAALKDAAVLKKETGLEDCANAYISLAENTSITGQFLHIDSGLAIQHF